MKIVIHFCLFKTGKKLENYVNQRKKEKKWKDLLIQDVFWGQFFLHFLFLIIILFSLTLLQSIFNNH